MNLILKIAAGVVIGLLLFQVIVFQGTEDNYEEMSKEVLYAQELRNKYIILTNSIHSYYRKNKKLPEFISDLKCRDILNNTRKKIDCASVLSNGVFYVNYKNDWASAEPYILDRKVFNKCKTSMKLDPGDGSYSDCLSLDVNAVPKKKTPAFDCSKTNNEVEKIICASDRLIESNVNLSTIYENLLSRSPDDQKQRIKDDQIEFNEILRNKCSTSECVKTMTTNKITRLELLGIWKKPVD